MGEKCRIDILLTKLGLAESREKAKSILMAGQVFVDNQKVDKAGDMIDENAHIEVRGALLPYVSRGGLKLEKAMKVFPIDLQGKVAMDIGASTGGFTDCMLQNGAQKVFAVDVGYGQLAWKLRQDPRVVNMERTNIRYVEPQHLGQGVDFVSVDVAFISLTLVLPVAKNLLKEQGEMVCLIKPQFEAGRDKVGKKGVVRDPEVHRQVIEKIVKFTAGIGLSPLKLSYSPIRGPEGNIEYLLYIRKNTVNVENPITEDMISEIVKNSHE